MLKSILKKTGQNSTLNLHKLCLAENRLDSGSAEYLNEVFIKTPMRILDVSNNRIILSDLDDLISTAGYKFELT